MYPQAYIDYLVHFHGDRDYFECHEILEEHWKEDEAKKRKRIWVGLIQIAVSLYHQRRKNNRGAYRMLKSAIFILEQEHEDLSKLGLDTDALFLLLKERLSSIKKEQPYESLFLPISDQHLLTSCMHRSKQKNILWWSNSDLTNTFIINRHTLRDRSDVVAERQMKLVEKQNNRLC
ncbi:DUF309 domain-containing protein [Metabacillus iocasae]|uniref:Metal-dependent hydrolase n=1 Tax=Priestia iocasae TaxID=2291674 RepID=A0ABS2QQD5_9BACI|nr:DUF309 domain-containing protein [Metabacillus iocasae]MBM7701669.1 putative metal-dependent hydrolase [Metabacillus iocasae]